MARTSKAPSGLKRLKDAEMLGEAFRTALLVEVYLSACPNTRPPVHPLENSQNAGRPFFRAHAGDEGLESLTSSLNLRTHLWHQHAECLELDSIDLRAAENSASNMEM